MLNKTQQNGSSPAHSPVKNAKFFARRSLQVGGGNRRKMALSKHIRASEDFDAKTKVETNYVNQKKRFNLAKSAAPHQPNLRDQHPQYMNNAMQKNFQNGKGVKK